MKSSKSVNTKLSLLKLKKKTIESTAQLISREIIMKFITIAGQLLIIRHLEPESFGFFAILSFLLNTAEIFSDIGLNLAIIQSKKNPTQIQLSSIFYIRMILAIIIVCILNFIAFFLTSIYPQLSNSSVLMLRLLSLTLLIRPLQSICGTLLERELRFKEIAIIDTIGIISFYAVTVLLALNQFGVWSLIWGTISLTVTETIITFIFQPFVPLFKFELREIKSYIALGKYFQIGFFIGVVHNSIIPVIGGRNLQLSAVGYLDWSNNMASFPRIFIDNISRVAFASYSRMQDKKEIIASSMEKTFEILSIPTTFFISLTILYGQEGIIYFLNNKWLPAYPTLSLYVLSVFFMNGTGLFGHALFAIGKVRELVLSAAILTFFEILLALIFLYIFGYYGIAISFFITSIVTFIVYIWMCNRERINVKITNIVRINIIILSITLLSGYIFNQILRENLIFFIFKIMFSGILYILMWIILSKKTIINCYNLVNNYFRK